MHVEHNHSAAAAGAGRLRIVLLVTAGFAVVELGGGLLTGSLALLADAGHMLADVTGLALALFAVKLASRPATSANTYGYYRVEILAALANCLLLLGIAAFILFEAYRRFSSPPAVDGGPVLLVAAAGLAVNIVSAGLLFEGQKRSLNLRAAFLEVLSDLVGSLAVIVAAAVLLATGYRLADPIASVFIGLLVLPRVWKLLDDTLHVLLEGAPRHLSLAQVQEHILAVEGVIAVHDLHAWSLTSGMDVVSAHVVIGEGCAPQQVLEELSVCLADHFDIEHCTFQIEQPDRSAGEHASHPLRGG